MTEMCPPGHRSEAAPLLRSRWTSGRVREALRRLGVTGTGADLDDVADSYRRYRRNGFTANEPGVSVQLHRRVVRLIAFWNPRSSRTAGWPARAELAGEA